MYMYNENFKMNVKLINKQPDNTCPVDDDPEKDLATFAQYHAKILYDEMKEKTYAILCKDVQICINQGDLDSLASLLDLYFHVFLRRKAYGLTKIMEDSLTFQTFCKYLYKYLRELQ